MIDASFVQDVYSGGGVSVYAVDLAPEPALEAACLALLDAPERARAARYLVAAPRRNFVITRGTLRLLLARHVDRAPETLTFAEGRYGKPFLVEQRVPARVAFNVSHSAHRALIAIGRGAIGVDIEFLGRDVEIDLVAKGVFTSAEQTALQERTGAARLLLFYRMWTQKEALIKAKGCGFAYPPRGFALPDALLAGARSATFGFPGEDVVWQITDLSAGEHAAALVQAVHGACP